MESTARHSSNRNGGATPGSTRARAWDPARFRTAGRESPRDPAATRSARSSPAARGTRRLPRRPEAGRPPISAVAALEEEAAREDTDPARTAVTVGSRAGESAGYGCPESRSAPLRARARGARSPRRRSATISSESSGLVDSPMKSRTAEGGEPVRVRPRAPVSSDGGVSGCASAIHRPGAVRQSPRAAAPAARPSPARPRGGAAALGRSLVAYRG